MVNKKEEADIEIDVTNEDYIENKEPELEEIEAQSNDKLKKLREKLATCTEEKRLILEDTQREKADFLNAKRRLMTEREQDKIRYVKKHVEALLPLCDSFDMARSNKELWEKSDENWRKGIEGIHVQLQKLIASYGVTEIDPIQQEFDPHKHEAITMVPVTEKDQHHKVLSVLQKGYEITADAKTEVIRPARVTTGEYTE